MRLRPGGREVGARQMTVYGLIQELKKYPDGMEVITWDEEGVSWPVILRQRMDNLLVVPDERLEDD